MMSRRLTRYLFTRHAVRVLMVMALVLFVIWLGQFADLVRRMTGTGLAALGQPLLLSLMRSPVLILDVLPHVVLVGSALTVFGLARRFEVQVIILTGQSLLQVLAPMALSGFMLGAGYLLAVDPAAAWLTGWAGPPGSSLAATGTQIAHEASLPLPGGGTVLIFARDVTPQDARAEGLSVFVLDARHLLAARIEAASADMATRPWRLTGAEVQRLAAAAGGSGQEALAAVLTDPPGAAPGFRPGPGPGLDLPTQTLLAEVRQAARLPLWALPDAIASARALGRPATDFQRALQRRLALPALLAAITILAGVLVMGRTGKEPWLRVVALLLVAAFLLYTVLTVADALGSRQRISALAAAWGPVGVTGLAGLLVTLWKRL